MGTNELSTSEYEEEASEGTKWEKITVGGGNNKIRGFEVGASLECLNKEVRMAGV